MLEDARKGARDVGQILESKQLQANSSKSKYVILAPQKSRTAMLKEAEANPIKMGECTIQNLKSEKYLGPKFTRTGQQKVS